MVFGNSCRRVGVFTDSRSAGGSTNGGEGIQLAYDLAEREFIQGGINRVILCSDGDFNVGITSQRELQGFVERKREKGIYLSVLMGGGLNAWRNPAIVRAT